MMAMMCDECGIRPASIRITTIVGGEKKEKNLCASCMAKIKESMPELDFTSLAGLLSGFFEAAKTAMVEEEVPNLTCSRCGMTYETFRKTGLLGCADCYKEFREPLEKLIMSIHANTQHTGRVPGGLAKRVSLKATVDQLKAKLVNAIAAEEYEEAAKLRDQIRALKQQLEEEVECHGGE